MACLFLFAPKKIFMWIFILCVVDTAENDRNGEYIFKFCSIF